MHSSKVPTEQFVLREAALLTEEQVSRSAHSTAGIEAKVARSRGRLAKQLHKLELIELVLQDQLAGRYGALTPAQMQLLAYPVHYLLDAQDLIPDSVPVAGLSDDIAVVVIVWGMLEKELRAYANWKGLHLGNYFDINVE